MLALFHFEEKVHRKNLSRVEAIPLLFPRLLSYVLEHLGFPIELHHEHRRDCEATFTLEKWQFVAGDLPLPACPVAEEDQQEVPPEVQHPPPAPPTPAQDSHNPVLPAYPPLPMPSTSAPAAPSPPPTPTTQAGLSTSAPPTEFVHIFTQHFLAIMTIVQNFAATSQTFAVAHIVMAHRMTCAKAILAQIQEHLSLPLIPITPLAAAALAPQAPTTTSSVGPSPTVPLASPLVASAALPVDHLTVPSQDEDEVPPPAPT